MDFTKQPIFFEYEKRSRSTFSNMTDDPEVNSGVNTDELPIAYCPIPP